MKFTIFLLPAVALGACPSACPYGTFKPEEPTDTRGVCPMLNTLANHGYLPRSGRGINENQTIQALNDALNIDHDFGQLLFRAGVLANPSPNATTFNLDHINRHDLFEHDGSLSRQDAYFGQWSRFNQTVWNWTMQYWTGDVLDVQMVANGRAQRATRSMLTNPEYKLSELGYFFSVGEQALILTVIGDKTTQTCPKKFADYFFTNERLPDSIGWKKSSLPISTADLAKAFHDVEAATAFPPPAAHDNSTEIFM